MQMQQACIRTSKQACTSIPTALAVRKPCGDHSVSLTGCGGPQGPSSHQQTLGKGLGYLRGAVGSTPWEKLREKKGAKCPACPYIGLLGAAASSLQVQARGTAGGLSPLQGDAAEARRCPRRAYGNHTSFGDTIAGNRSSVTGTGDDRPLRTVLPT